MLRSDHLRLLILFIFINLGVQAQTKKTDASYKYKASFQGASIIENSAYLVTGVPSEVRLALPKQVAAVPRLAVTLNCSVCSSSTVQKKLLASGQSTVSFKFVPDRATAPDNGEGELIFDVSSAGVQQDNIIVDVKLIPLSLAKASGSRMQTMSLVKQ